MQKLDYRVYSKIAELRRKKFMEIAKLDADQFMMEIIDTEMQGSNYFSFKMLYQDKLNCSSEEFDLNRNFSNRE